MGTKIMGATKVRQNFTGVLDNVSASEEPLYITHRGDPKAVLCGYEFFEALTEKLEDLEDILALYRREGEERIPLEEIVAKRERQAQRVPGIPVTVD